MRTFVLFLALHFISASYAQRIQNLNLYPTATSVVIKFTILSGPSCSGYSILHSSDSLTYTQIGYEPGICGVSTVGEPKTYTHASPVFGQVNYYKVRLEPYLETSYSGSIFLTASGTSLKMLLYPNPLTTHDRNITLQFSNLTNVKLSGYIYHHSGATISSLELQTAHDMATLPTEILGNGIYLLWLTDGSQIFTSKFIVLR